MKGEIIMDLSKAKEVSRLVEEIEQCEEILENFKADFKYAWVLYNDELSEEIKLSPQMFAIFVDAVKEKRRKAEKELAAL